MKTRIAALLPAAVLIVSLGACSSDTPKSESTTTGDVTSTTAASNDASTTTVDGGGSSTTAAPSGSELSKNVADHLGAAHNQTDVTVTGDESAGIKIVYGSSITPADAGSLCANAAMVAGPQAAITVEGADGAKAVSRPAGGSCA